MNKPRAKTAEEVRTEFLNYIHSVSKYWATLDEDCDIQCRLDGLAFSILNIFDGTTMKFPAMDIVLRPHPNDKEFLQNEGENWCEPGMIINDDCCFHELWYKTQ